MEQTALTSLLTLYNPWWEAPGGDWRSALPDYERPVVSAILGDLKASPQMVSITGPRRVGKTTAIRHVVCRLLDEWGVPPAQILYFSFDDPAVFGSVEFQRVVFDQLVERFKASEGPCYFLLDEIQRLPQWELYLKKYYDLKAPIRFIVSGSASSPIFRKSQESLLGRIKDRHLLPFSFREYCAYQLRNHPWGFGGVLAELPALREPLLAGDGQGALEALQRVETALAPYLFDINEAVRTYCQQGGFPEVWPLLDPLRKMEYLLENHVRKVLYEDLMSTTRYRKPENVLRFFVYVLSQPGCEINTAQIASEAGVERRVVDDNLPLLEMTDLVVRVRKFSHQPVRVRSGNIKVYPVDLALRNAVLKQWEDFTANPTTMGLFAENLVAHELKRWPEALEVAYYREKNTEVDFVVTHGGNRHLPIEVKHRNTHDQVRGLRHFMKKYPVNLGVVVTRDLTPKLESDILWIPLRYFLLTN